MKPPALGTVWIARAILYNNKMKPLGSCIDTPNGIAKALIENKKAVYVKPLDEPIIHRYYYNPRMNKWNKAKSYFQPLEGE